MGLIKIQHRIEANRKLLADKHTQLEEFAQKRAEAEADYERQLAVTLIKLRNKKAFELDGELIKDPPATYAKDIAKGICWEAKLKQEATAGKYKATLERIQSLRTAINADQSILKYMEEAET